MTRVRVLGGALVALAAVALLVPSAAHAAAASGDELGTEWAADTVNLAWDGETYTTSSHSFVGVPVAVPGDRAYRILAVTNDGPTDGLLRAWVHDVELSAPPGSTTEFFDALELDWASASGASSASLQALGAAGSTQVAELTLAAGQSTELTIGYRLPAGTTSGNRAHDGELAASFAVLLQIGGVLDPGDQGDPGRPGGGGSGGTGGTGVGTGGGAGGIGGAGVGTGSASDDLAETGADFATAASVALIAAAVGLLLVLVARRRERPVDG